MADDAQRRPEARAVLRYRDLFRLPGRRERREGRPRLRARRCERGTNFVLLSLEALVALRTGAGPVTKEQPEGRPEMAITGALPSSTSLSSVAGRPAWPPPPQPPPEAPSSPGRRRPPASVASSFANRSSTTARDRLRPARACRPASTAWRQTRGSSCCSAATSGRRQGRRRVSRCSSTAAPTLRSGPGRSSSPPGPPSSPSRSRDGNFPV